MPSTVAAPGSRERVLEREAQEVAVQRRRQVRRVGVPEQDVERRRRLAHQVVGDPVVPDQVVRAQPREHARERAPARGSPCGAESAVAAIAVSAPMNAPVVPGVVLVEHGDAERHARRSGPARPCAARCATTVESTMPPAHRPITWVLSAPVISSTASSASSTAPRVGVEVPVGVALGRVAPGDREHLLAVLDRVLHHAAARREVGDVVLVDHRRREQQRLLVHLRRSAACTAGARTPACAARPRPA